MLLPIARSLLLRRINKDAVKIKPRIEEILGHDNGYNGQLQRWRLGEHQIDIAGCEQESDKQRFKGDPHDLIVFDEGTDFLESQYRFIIGWNRSTDPNQRCRVLVTSNPPTTADGLWVVKYWGPWLDRTHPNPAKPGELRWFTTINGEDREVDGPGPHMIDGEAVYAALGRSSEQPCPTTQTWRGRAMPQCWRGSPRNYAEPTATAISQLAFEMQIFR
jgi:hypothetical protein